MKTILKPLALIAVMLLIQNCSTKKQVYIGSMSEEYGGLQGNIKIVSPIATYYFNPAGGGFAGIIDTDGNDWVAHNTAKGAAGEWRGIPNTNVVGWRPEQKGSTTTVIKEKNNEIILSVSKGNNKCTWSFFPDHATMKMVQIDSVFYFSYEGAPFGKFDTLTSYMVRQDHNTRYFLGKASPETDINDNLNQAYEWVYFSDTMASRAFVLLHHQNDTIPDYYRPLEQMTVFGFARTSWGMENIYTLPAEFSMFFSEDTSRNSINKKCSQILQ